MAAELFRSTTLSRRFDPVKCQRRLFIESNGAINDWIATYEGKPDVEQSLIDVTRRVFDLDNYDSRTRNGVTDKQCLDLLAEFTEYIAKKP